MNSRRFIPSNCIRSPPARAGLQDIELARFSQPAGLVGSRFSSASEMPNAGSSQDLFLIAQIDGGSGIHARRLVEAVDGECALVGMCDRSRSVSKRRDTELV